MPTLQGTEERKAYVGAGQPGEAGGGKTARVNLTLAIAVAACYTPRVPLGR